MSVPGGTREAPSERYVDLHMHSTASDGAVAPADVVAAAQRAGLTAIALTDHDTVDGVAAAQAAGDVLGVRVVAGVELSAVDDGEEIHVLGLHLAHPEHIASALEELKETRRERARTTVERLNALGVPVTLEAVFAAAGEGAVGRPHVAKALVAGGWARDFRDAFDRWLGNGKPACIEKRTVTFEEAARLIHDAGGLAVYAHPGGAASRASLEMLASFGLDAVEVRHPSHTADEVVRLAALTNELGLVPSGGSDWHGAPEGYRALGSMKVSIDWLVRQD
ncbi:MAG: PHP domain-containing protein, partial [Gemmatimonadaceae bacterium]|nr:PHP domain-containing protein [Gemmatimonadaceae bacterium]